MGNQSIRANTNIIYVLKGHSGVALKIVLICDSALFSLKLDPKRVILMKSITAMAPPCKDKQITQ